MGTTELDRRLPGFGTVDGEEILDSDLHCVVS